MQHYEVRGSPVFEFVRIELEDRHRWSMHKNATLWQVERESEADAAVRRMNWMSKTEATERVTINLMPGGRTLAEILDERCPPPPPKETQLDWNTGKPIRAVKTWQESSGVWIACVSDSSPERLYCSCIVSGKLAVGDSRETAIANLKAIQQII
jgi:hypothetical protein